MMPPTDLIENQNPYPGLRPFQADETHLFFGRDEQTVELLQRLQRSRFLAIVGTSGSGKSSLVRAGLLQGLYGGLMAGGGSQWRVVDLRPGTDPLSSLTHALDRPGALREQGCPPEDSFTDATLRRSSLGLVQAVREARLDAGVRVLVLVDQFEELFRAIEADASARLGDDATAFVKLLLEASHQDARPIYVVLTMRSDFLGECARFADLPEAISDGQYLIPRLTRDQRREAITGPAAVQGVSLSPTLVNRLLNDVGENPDQLPILQHALMRTWDLWARDPQRGKVIDLPDYERIGGMAKALSHHADAVLEGLGAGDAARGQRRRLIAERLFKSLAIIGASGRYVRRFVQLQEVADVADAAVEEVIAVVEAFRESRNSFLMPPASEPLTAATSIDISHESLIRNWSTMGRWLSEETESARIYQRLATNAADRAKGTGDLYGERALNEAITWRDTQRPTAVWAQRYGGDFAQAMNFLDDSYARTAARGNERARRRRIRRATVAVTFMALLAIAVTWVAQEYDRRRMEERVVNAKLGLLEELSAMDGPDTTKCGKLLELEANHSVLGTVNPVLCPAGPGDKGNSAWFTAFFEFVRQLKSGDFDQAEKTLQGAPAAARQSVSDFMEQLATMDSARIRRERYELVQLNEEIRRNEKIAAQKGVPGSDARPARPALAGKQYVHPVHATMAMRMSSENPVLSKTQCALLDHYLEIETPIRVRRRNALAEKSQKVAYCEKGEMKETVDSPWLPKVAMQVCNTQRVSCDAVYRYSVRMQEAMQQNQQQTLLNTLRDHTLEITCAVLVMLAWPVWRVRRWWQRRRGESIPPTPSAMRRAASAAMDSGIAFCVSFAVGAWTYGVFMATVVDHDVAIPVAIIAGIVSGSAYLLFCDAIRFRYRRSLGKIAFNLRPVRDAAPGAGVIGRTVSAKRNAPLVVATGAIGLAFSHWTKTWMDGLSGLPGEFVWQLVLFVLALLAVFWLPIILLRARTLGDRWSHTHAIDADSAESLTIDVLPGYMTIDPARTSTIHAIQAGTHAGDITVPPGFASHR